MLNHYYSNHYPPHTVSSLPCVCTPRTHPRADFVYIHRKEYPLDQVRHLFGPGPAPIWTRSTHTLDLVQAPPCRHCATSNAEIHEKCVTHCILCNEQRGNPPKPCCSLHAFPHHGAGLHYEWRRFTPRLVQVSQCSEQGVSAN